MYTAFVWQSLQCKLLARCCILLQKTFDCIFIDLFSVNNGNNLFPEDDISFQHNEAAVFVLIFSSVDIISDKNL